MAFTSNQIQSVFGEFQPVIDSSIKPTVNQFRGVFGVFKFALDRSAGIMLIVYHHRQRNF